MNTNQLSLAVQTIVKISTNLKERSNALADWIESIPADDPQRKEKMAAAGGGASEIKLIGDIIVEYLEKAKNL